MFFDDVSYNQWIIEMIKDICRDLQLNCEKEHFYELVFDNIIKLLDYKKSAETIANQEFVDVIRKVVSFTLTGNVFANNNFSSKFNGLAKQIMPYVIEKFKTKKYPIKDLLVYSILSGLSGLDLKGSPAAASSYSNTGIPMNSYFDMSSTSAAEEYTKSLQLFYEQCSTDLFDYTEFEDMLSSKSKLLWMTDDYIESYFDLLIISSILETFPISIVLLPKNGYQGNDLCYQDLMDILSSGLYPSLPLHIKDGRLIISAEGPKMGAANVNKMSYNCVELIEQSDLIFMKGCRIHEMLQGGLNKHTFSSFVVVRRLSEITSGFSASLKPVLFFHLSPEEYSFWGIDHSDVIAARSNTRYSVSTIKEHFKRKRITNIAVIIDEFVKMKRWVGNYRGNPRPLLQELNMLAQKMQRYTKEQYDENGNLYQLLVRPDMDRIDSELWQALFNSAKEHLHKNANELSLLDIGTGDGRAIEYLSSLGVQVIGIDNSLGFIEILKEKESTGIIPPDSYIFSDMCSLDVKSEQFDIVRMNASLLHLPLITKGFTVDLALQEAYRSLKPGGILYILVKHGTGLVLVDTNEGLGRRVYQLYDHKELEEVLIRNGFLLLESIDKYEHRGSNTIRWIAQIVQKPNL